MKDFVGNLKKISPDKLLDTERDDRLQEFFLILGIIFNDLKGLVFFQSQLSEQYRKPGLDEISVHQGEFSGLSVQYIKFVASVVHEFFNFLGKYNDATSAPRFRLLVSKLSKDQKNKWEELEAIARGKTDYKTAFAKAMLQIRNTAGFHYDHSGKNMRRAFFERFLDGSLIAGNESAYYYADGSMKKTRFFFSDGMIQQYLSSKIDDEKWGEKLNKTIDDMNITITNLMLIYLDYCKVKK